MQSAASRKLTQFFRKTILRVNWRQPMFVTALAPYPPDLRTSRHHNCGALEILLSFRGRLVSKYVTSIHVSSVTRRGLYSEGSPVCPTLNAHTYTTIRAPGLSHQRTLCILLVGYCLTVTRFFFAAVLEELNKNWEFSRH